MTSDPIWLFDGQCVLCSSGVRYTLRHEKTSQIRFVAIQSNEGRTLADRHGIDPDDPATFLFIENGRALEKSDAVIAIARHLNGPARFGRLLRFIPRPLRDAAYTVIARNRYRIFGKTETCMVPHPDQRDRFVL
ncbi:thiol-disulfide oxidoreductase DCC family protein [uncultured Roseobacter sp.]|uniref:thiol-disulfide oxidoreductase DCC family protein n=1 Tax=uncultured Roseobacter sp. TaxID=114847 RepID=UPI0026261819|nr:thiol-disulfide oxidoreductase DCC family protein [uncultured Roseobacter sp.]